MLNISHNIYSNECSISVTVLPVAMWTGFWNGLRGISECPPPHKPHSVWSCGGIRLGGHAYDAYMYNGYRCLLEICARAQSMLFFLGGGFRMARGGPGAPRGPVVATAWCLFK